MTTALASCSADRVSAETSTHALGEAIASLAARIHAATYELLVLLREFDTRAGWSTGFLSCAHWLHWRTGIDLGACREKVRVAKALAALPLTSATMQRGALSYAKVRALTRVATPENEARLVDLALAGTAAHVERFVRAWRRVDRVEELREANARHLSRHLSTWVDDDGMVVVRGRLTPEAGAVVQRALEAAADRLFRDSGLAAPGLGPTEDVTSSHRRADALVLLAEAALTSNLDAGSAGDRYQVVLYVDASAADPVAGELAAAPDTDAFDGVLEMESGALRVSAETSRRLACDASLVVIGNVANGDALKAGRKTRTIPAAIRRALAARDRTCRFPGCTSRRCDAHHLVHWADGGATRVHNLVLLCRRHHRSVHEGLFSVDRCVDGEVTFCRPDGTPVAMTPPESRAHGSLAAEPRRVAELPVWDGTRFDVAWAIDVIRPQAAASA